MRWFGPADCTGFHAVELDVREGGKYHIGFSTSNGEDNDVHGVYEKVVPNELLQFSWAWKSTPDRVSLVTVRLKPVEGGTELDFTHERFFDRQAAANHKRGWTATFEKLDALLARGNL